MKRILLPLSFVLLSIGCGTDDHEAYKALSDNGFTNIHITDRGFMFASFHGCSEKDGNSYYANANNPISKPVEMLVCCGSKTSFKGCTVRSK